MDYTLSTILAMTGTISSTNNGRQRLQMLLDRIALVGVDKALDQYYDVPKDKIPQLKIEIAAAEHIMENDVYAGLANKHFP
jgi:hypothetical protein